MIDRNLNLYPHHLEVMNRLTSSYIEESLHEASVFAQSNKDFLESTFKKDPTLEDAFRLVLEVNPRSVNDGQTEVNENLDLPNRMDIPTRKGFSGSLSFDDTYYIPKPEFDLSECIKKTIPVPVVQLLLEGNSILEDFHEERNESQTFSDHMYCSDSIQDMIDELDSLNIKEFKAKVDSGDLYGREKVAMQIQSEKDCRLHANSVRKRAKQKAKRK